MQIGDRSLIKAEFPVRENNDMNIYNKTSYINFRYIIDDKAMTK